MEDEQFQKKKKCETERERSNKKVFIWSYGSKPPGSRDTEISSPPDFCWWGFKQTEKKKLLKFCCSEVKRKCLGFGFRSCLKRKTEFVFEIYLDKVFTRQNRINPPKPTNEKYTTFEIRVKRMPKF